MIRRFIDWFWRGGALRHARANRDPAREERLTAAGHLLDASLRLGLAPATERAQWLLLREALEELGGEEALLDPGLARDDVASIRRQVRDREAVLALARTVQHLHRTASRMTPRPGQVLRQRRLRLAALVAVTGLIVTFGWINPWWLRNKAMGARWVASSAHPIANITETGVLGPPPPDAFFITKEDERPWLIVDLGEVEEISRIRVVNRVGAEVRSVPLTVEVSEDRQTWRVVAKRERVFSTWVARFPRTPARYVRLSVAKKAYFALNDLQIL